MKILFTVPISKERFNVIPDLGLGYLASCAREAGHVAGILDCVLDRCDLDGFGRRVAAFKPDVLGLKVYSCDIGTAREMLRWVRHNYPDTVSVVGGPHPSCEHATDLFNQLPDLNYAFAGEAEPGFVRFLERITAGKKDMEGVPGILWKSGNGMVQVNAKASVEDLDALPFPAWDLMDPRRYTCGYSFITTKLPAAPMALTRGCPFSCTFCGSHLITGRRVRKRSLDNIIEEIKLLQHSYGVRTIDIVDENLAFDREFVIAFCERLLQENLGIAWNCPYGVRLNSLDETVVRSMARAGCFGLSVGVESGSPRILEAIRKNLSVEDVIEKVRMIKRVTDMTLQGYFMMGFPEETREDIEASIRLACSLPFDLVTFCPLRVTPGTEVYETLQAAGRIPRELDYRGLGHHYFVRSYCSVPDDEMRRLYRKAYLSFYSRPRIIWSLFRRLRSWSHVKTIVNGLRRMLYSPKHPQREQGPFTPPANSSHESKAHDEAGQGVKAE